MNVIRQGKYGDSLSFTSDCQNARLCLDCFGKANKGLAAVFLLRLNYQQTILFFGDEYKLPMTIVDSPNKALRFMLGELLLDIKKSTGQRSIETIQELIDELPNAGLRLKHKVIVYHIFKDALIK